MRGPITDEILVGDFHQGQACSRRDGYRSDCPVQDDVRKAAWMAGFEDEEGPNYVKGKTNAFEEPKADGPLADKLRALGFTNRQAEHARATMQHETGRQIDAGNPQ